MRWQMLSLVLVVSWCSGSQAEEGKAKPSLFKEMVGEAGGAEAFAGILYGFVPPVSSWDHMKYSEKQSFKDFSKKLMQALESPDTKDHKAAMTFVQFQAAFARKCASERGRNDLEAATRRTFAPHGKAIAAALEKGLASKSLTIRWQAASALLAFQPDHAKANSILAEGVEAKDKQFRENSCKVIGRMLLSNQQAVKTLIVGLGDKEPDVRRMAANAVMHIGPNAKASVPALIRFLDSGEEVYGLVGVIHGMEFPRSANLALSALAAMGPHAQPAVPTILRIFPKAKDGEKLEMLACLAALGPSAKESIPTIEIAMKNADTKLRLFATCAMARVDPENKTAAALVKHALKSKGKDVRAHALEACIEITPSSKVVVAALISLLDDEDEVTRRHATAVLGNIGPEAAEAVPALEKLLLKKDDHQTHTFLSHQAAAWALGRMGKACVPALIRATAKESDARQYAIQALGCLGKEIQPAGVDCLTKILREEDGFFAAISLGGLGEYARAARPALERRRIWIQTIDFLVSLGERAGAAPALEQLRLYVSMEHQTIAWALMEIPE